jgi:hypothetical protein
MNRERLNQSFPFHHRSGLADLLASGMVCCIAAKSISRSELPILVKSILPHTISALERRNDVIHAWFRVEEIGLNDKRQGWPNTQAVPHRCSACIENPEIQATW